MKLRKYTPDDCSILAELFFNTVHSINSKDYTKPQLNVWATGSVDIANWNKSFLEHYTMVAEIDSIIVGFGDINNDGYLDRLYVHKDYQNRGIATALTNELEQHAVTQGITIFTTHSSITAKPFFEKNGYYVICENEVVRSGIKLTNYIMEKSI